MYRSLIVLIGIGSLVGLLASPVLALKGNCADDSAQVGNICVDLYEASIWEIADTPGKNARLINKVRKGIATLADLKSGGTQHGATEDDYDPGCPDTGNHCTDFYAVSIPGVRPSANLTWFQAAAACRNAGKRLLTNAEWQAAALGTPDGVPCIVGINSGGHSAVTGTPGCESDAGMFDMVGNLEEWVADWIPPANACSDALFGTDDDNCMTIDPTHSTRSGPAALLRGGPFSANSPAGVFTVYGIHPPSFPYFWIGFRCGR